MTGQNKITGGLLALGIIARLLLTWNRALNADEFQHLHNAWMIVHNFLPYRDFWDNHTPLLHTLLAPLLSLAGEKSSSVLWIRLALSIAALGILPLTYFVARKVSRSADVGVLSVFVLNGSDIFLQKTIEVRPDPFLVMFWLASILLLLKDRPGYLGAGVLLGFGALFSPKALFCLAAGLLMILAMAFRDHHRGWINLIGRSSLYIAGFLIPIGILVLLFHTQNAAGHLLRSTLFENLGYPGGRRASFLWFPQNAAFFTLGIAGMIRACRGERRREALVLIIPGLCLFLIVAAIMPARFPQSSLVFLPLFAVFGGMALHDSLRDRKILFGVFTLATALIIPAASLAMSQPLNRSNAAQLKLVDRILGLTGPEDAVFDGNAAYVFRQQAYYYGSLVEGVRAKIKKKSAQDEIAQSLLRTRCKVVIYDDRVSDLPMAIQEFIRNNYVSPDQSELYIAGKRLGAESLSGNRARFRIDLPLVYSIEAEKVDRLLIDGEPYAGPLMLQTGRHRLEADVPLQGVLVIAAMKQE